MMEVRKLEAMLQVAKENAEAERIAGMRKEIKRERRYLPREKERSRGMGVTTIKGSPPKGKRNV